MILRKLLMGQIVRQIQMKSIPKEEIQEEQVQQFNNKTQVKYLQYAYTYNLMKLKSVEKSQSRASMVIMHF